MNGNAQGGVAMKAPSYGYRFQVHLDIELGSHEQALVAMTEWLSEWEMCCQLTAFEDRGRFRVRAAFDEERFARAFEVNYGGRRLSGDELSKAMKEDTEHEVLFDEMATRTPP